MGCKMVCFGDGCVRFLRSEVVMWVVYKLTRLALGLTEELLWTQVMVYVGMS